MWRLVDQQGDAGDVHVCTRCGVGGTKHAMTESTRSSASAPAIRGSGASPLRAALASALLAAACHSFFASVVTGAG